MLRTPEFYGGRPWPGFDEWLSCGGYRRRGAAARVNVRFRADNRYAAGESDGVSTDETGHYSIDKLGPYAWSLLLMTDGYPYQWSGNVSNRFNAVRIPVRAADSTTYDEALTRTATLRGTITPPTGSVRRFAHNAATGDLVGVLSMAGMLQSPEGGHLCPLSLHSPGAVGVTDRSPANCLLCWAESP